MRRRFLGLNFIQCVYIDYITCTFIILYIQECLNHGGSNSIQEGNKYSLDELNDPQSSWKYVENMYYTVKSTPLKSILSDYNASPS